MKTTRITAKLSIALGAAFAFSLAASAQNLVSNPDFQISDSDPNWAGGVGAADWTASATSGDIAPTWGTTSPTGVPSDPANPGNHFALFTTSDGDYFDISQTVTVTQSGWYHFSYSVYANYGDTDYPDVSGMIGTVNGAGENIGFVGPTPGNTWEGPITDYVALDAGSYTVNFYVGTWNIFVGVDDVELYPAYIDNLPDNASSFWLLAAAAGALALVEAVRSRRLAGRGHRGSP